ncbi:hypothetical protein SASPL_108683 [Salvia splendens]|uniref:Uncharacterized protein n=1 Tax=Salvia splendens TaxID=180675 RepID=A0A8X8YDI6_SALSN|nr:hypothetical protein SASPL_108683 [Salvia splendens]
MFVQDINIQSHVLISLKDSNKCLYLVLEIKEIINLVLLSQDDRERIIVRRFKFEELRIEEIQYLEVSNLF